MRIARIISLIMFGFLMGAGLVIATGEPLALFAGPPVVFGIEYLQANYNLGNVLGINLSNITKNLTNGNNMGGIQETIYWGLWEDVQTWPALSTSPANLTAVVEPTGTLAMKAGKYLYTLYNTVDAGELKFEQQGEIDGISYKGVLSIFHPGMQKKILGFMSQMKNENLFFIVKDAEGQMFLFGDANFAAKLESGNTTTSQKTSGRKGTTMNFFWYTNTPIILDSSFNPATLLNGTSGSGS